MIELLETITIPVYDKKVDPRSIWDLGDWEISPLAPMPTIPDWSGPLSIEVKFSRDKGPLLCENMTPGLLDEIMENPLYREEIGNHVRGRIFVEGLWVLAEVEEEV